MNTRLQSLFVALLCLALTLAWSSGCASTGSSGGNSGGKSGSSFKPIGPDFMAAANYESNAAPSGIADGATIAVRVRDARITKGPTRSDGREVIAQGDKAKVFLPQSPANEVKAGLIAGLKKAGFRVDANASVVLDVELRRMDLIAWQFTHWNLPSERGSTLDAIGAILPGPTRKTLASTVISATIRKHDQSFGYSHYVEKNAEGTSTSESIVTQALSRSMSNAINELITRAGPDVAMASKLPVTDAEFAARNSELEARIATLESQKKALESGKVSKADLDAARAEKQRLATALEQRDGEITRLQAAVSARSGDSQRLQEQIRKIQGARNVSAAQRRAQLTALEREVGRLEGERRELSTQLAAAKNQKQSTTTNLQQATQREQTLAKLTKNLKVELASAQTEISRLNAEVERMVKTKKAFGQFKSLLAGKTDNVQPPAGVVAYLKENK